MKSKKIEDQTILQQGGDLAEITQALMNKAQNQRSDYVLLNKSLLPSKGFYYPNDIFIKKMSTVDIKNLSTITSDTVTSVLNGTLARNIQGINVNDILIGDKIWFIFYLRNYTYNDYPFNVKYECEHCGMNGLYQMTSKDIIVDYLSDDFDLKYTLNNGDEIEIGFPTVGNEIQCNQILKEPDKWSISAIDEQLLDISCFIKKVNGNSLSIMKAYNYIENMDALSFSDFTNHMAEINFGVKPYITIKCSCTNEINVPLSFSPEYFMPKIK